MSVTPVQHQHPLPTLALLSQPCTAGPRRTLTSARVSEWDIAALPMLSSFLAGGRLAPVFPNGQVSKVLLLFGLPQLSWYLLLVP